MHRKTLLTLASAAAFAAAMPAVYADDESPGSQDGFDRGDQQPDWRNPGRDLRGVWSHRRSADLSRDRRDVVQDRGDIRGDRVDLRGDRLDVRSDFRDLNRDRAELRAAERARDEAAIARERADIRSDRADIHADLRDIRGDRRDIREDRRRDDHDFDRFRDARNDRDKHFGGASGEHKDRHADRFMEVKRESVAPMKR